MGLSIQLLLGEMIVTYYSGVTSLLCLCVCNRYLY